MAETEEQVSTTRTGLSTIGTLLVALAVIAGCAPPTEPPAAGAQPPIVTTDVGQLRGTVDGDVVRHRAVPFAEPPVGDRRWAPPQPVAPWEGVRDATASASPCPQPASAEYGRPQTDENCLYLEVTAPAGPGAGRPVLLWLHGGLNTGSAAQYDPRRMAAQGDAVVVTTNFRHGLLGQLALPGMDGGSYAYADQREAMRFLRRNAAAFGGDPDNITIFGVSGGGVSTCVQLASPAAEGLFDKAIMQSADGLCADPLAPDFFGPGTSSSSVSAYTPRGQAERDGLALAATWGCTDPATALDCARDVPVDTIVQGPYGGIVGVGPGTSLPRSPMAAVLTGEINRVPVLTGYTRDESHSLLNMVLSAGLPSLTEETYEATVRTAYAARADEVLAEYPVGDHESPNAAWIALTSDRTWACPGAAFNDELSAHTPVFAYEFADRTAPIFPPPVPGYPSQGAGHGSELPYQFDLSNAPDVPPFLERPLTDAQLQVGAEMNRVWTDFARTGRTDTPTWSRERPIARTFGDPEREVDLRARHNCDFWAPDIQADLARPPLSLAARPGRQSVASRS